MTTDDDRPTDSAGRTTPGVHGSHGSIDPQSGDPITPGQAQVGEADLDQSAGETGAPSDMGYYRTTQKTGARLALGTLAVPIALVLLVIIAMILFRP